MRIILFSRPQSARAAEGLHRLFAAAERLGFDIVVNEEFAPAAAEVLGAPLPADRIYGARLGTQPEGTVMLCYGGDGTLLEGVHRLGGAPIPVMGINAGHLGFLTSAPQAGPEPLLERLASGRISVEPRTMIEVRGDFGAEDGRQLALNEFAVQRRGAGLIAVETDVDGEAVATYRGDGAIVATPTGSTAYSLSAGGPVVAPACACLVVSPLAPHNLTMRPVVIPDTAEVTMRIRTRHAAASVTLDNRSYPVADGASFRIRRAEERILLAVPHNISFYDTLRNKMMWGVDIRS